jgi:hypothetical protein
MRSAARCEEITRLLATNGNPAKSCYIRSAYELSMWLHARDFDKGAEPVGLDRGFE